MKKIICLLLLLFLLCSCAKVQQVKESEPSIKESEPQEPEQVSEDESGNIVFSVDKIKDLESRNYGSYSRYNKEYTTEFVPRDDYGRLYLFAGGVKSFTYDGSYGGAKVGLCTEKGEVVVDPVYDLQGVWKIGDHYVYSLQYLDYSTVKGLDDNWEAQYAETKKYVIIRSDGKKMLELEGREGIYYYDRTHIQAVRVEYNTNGMHNYYSDIYDEDLNFAYTETIDYRFPDVTMPMESAGRVECPQCGQKTNKLLNTFNYEKSERSFYGYLHENCADGKTAVLDKNGEFVSYIPSGEWEFRGSNGRYFCFVDTDYKTLKTYFCDKETNGYTVLDKGVIYHWLAKDKFSMGFIENDMVEYNIYHADTAVFQPVTFAQKAGDSIIYHDGNYAGVKDSNYNDILKVIVNAD